MPVKCDISYRCLEPFSFTDRIISKSRNDCRNTNNTASYNTAVFSCRRIAIDSAQRILQSAERYRWDVCRCRSIAEDDEIYWTTCGQQLLSATVSTVQCLRRHGLVRPCRTDRGRSDGGGRIMEDSAYDSDVDICNVSRVFTRQSRLDDYLWPSSGYETVWRRYSDQMHYQCTLVLSSWSGQLPTFGRQYFDKSGQVCSSRWQTSHLKWQKLNLGVLSYSVVKYLNTLHKSGI